MLRLILGAIRLYLARSRRVSVAIDKYPYLRHVDIKRGEPIRFKFSVEKGREWFMEIPPLSVDDAIRCSQFQAVVKGQIAEYAKKAVADPEFIPVLAELRAAFFRSMADWFIEMAVKKIKGRFRRIRFRDDARRCFERDQAEGLKIFNQILEFNASIDSFFFEMPRVDRRAIQPPNRDGWRAIGCGDIGSKRGNILAAPILEIYDMIVYQLENECVEKFNRDKEEFEKAN